MRRRLFAAAVALAVNSQAVAQKVEPDVATLAYALKRICGWHLEGTSGASSFISEVELNGWAHITRSGVTYDKSGDWGRIQVLYSKKDFASRCMVSVTPVEGAGADINAMRSAVEAFVSERFPKARKEKDRLPAAANADVIESVWTDENARWSVRLGEMPVADRGPILRVVWDRAF